MIRSSSQPKIDGQREILDDRFELTRARALDERGQLSPLARLDS